MCCYIALAAQSGWLAVLSLGLVLLLGLGARAWDLATQYCACNSIWVASCLRPGSRYGAELGVLVF